MSAYIVSRARIATLAAFACGGRREISCRFGSIVEVANKLAVENAISVAYRYKDQPVDGGVEFLSEQGVWNAARLELHQPLVILKAVNCLQYQSCEHPEWKDSEAAQILEQIKSAAIRMLPGYEDAEGWEIEDAVGGPKVMSLSAMAAGAYRGL